MIRGNHGGRRQRTSCPLKWNQRCSFAGHRTSCFVIESSKFVEPANNSQAHMQWFRRRAAAALPPLGRWANAWKASVASSNRTRRDAVQVAMVLLAPATEEATMDRPLPLTPSATPPLSVAYAGHVRA